MTKRKVGLILLNAGPLGVSLYLVARLYGGQLDIQIASLRNVPYFLGLVLVCMVGYTNTIWRYIMALNHEGLRVDERAVSERLMLVNLISLFLPFGILNYAAQLALVYRGNPVRIVGRAFLHDKLVFLGAIASCFVFTFAGLTPVLIQRFGFAPAISGLFMAAVGLGVAGLVAYLIWRRYAIFYVAQLAVFGAMNASIAALLMIYLGGADVGTFWLCLQKLFAYSLAVVLPVSLGGVGPREAILLFDVDVPAVRAAILQFCVLWFAALVAAALFLFAFKRSLSAFAARLHLRWRRTDAPVLGKSAPVQSTRT